MFKFASTSLDPFALCIADVQIVPLGVGVSVSKYVAACEKVCRHLPLANFVFCAASCIGFPSAQPQGPTSCLWNEFRRIVG